MPDFVVLRGPISNYRGQRGAANFFFTAVDQQALGMNRHVDFHGNDLLGPRQEPRGIGRVAVLLLAVAVVAGLMLLPTVHMILKYVRFVRAAERVFEALQWKAPRFVDLVKSSNRLASEDDAPERGVYYFRY